MVKPTLGIIGGGQLGSMMAVAAKKIKIGRGIWPLEFFEIFFCILKVRFSRDVVLLKID